MVDAPARAAAGRPRTQRGRRRSRSRRPRIRLMTLMTGAAASVSGELQGMTIEDWTPGAPCEHICAPAAAHITHATSRSRLVVRAIVEQRCEHFEPSRAVSRLPPRASSSHTRLIHTQSRSLLPHTHTDFSQTATHSRSNKINVCRRSEKLTGKGKHTRAFTACSRTTPPSASITCLRSWVPAACNGYRQKIWHRSARSARI